MNIEQRPRIKVSVNGREMEVYGNLTILQSLIQKVIYKPAGHGKGPRIAVWIDYQE